MVSPSTSAARDPARTAAQLVRAVERASRAPFFARKLAAAGVTPANAADPAAWRAIPPTTKDELRGIEVGRLYDEIVIAPPEDIREFWRSGGTTGVPLFYPRTHEDHVAALEGFQRVFRIARVTPRDVIHFSFPLGIHPAGQMLVRAGQAEGAAVVWAGAGATMPSEVQVQIVHQLGATVWAGMASYGMHLASLATAGGRDFATAGRVQKLITSAEMISPAKRAKIEAQWGAKLYDTFGMSEAGLMAAECEQARGLHLWTDLFQVEVLNPRTFEPVPEGGEGVLVVTPLETNHATPFVRWVSGDVVTLTTSDCACGPPFAAFPLLRHAGRTEGFSKIKGVNVNHGELEDFLLAASGVADYRVVLRTVDAEREELLIELEVEAEAPPETTAEVERAVCLKFGVGTRVESVARGTHARRFEGAVKAQRFVDERG